MVPFKCSDPLIPALIVIDRAGRVVKSFPSAVDPDDPTIRKVIEANL